MREKACFDFICYFNRTLKYTALNIITLYTSKISYMFTLLVLTDSNVTQKIYQLKSINRNLTNPYEAYVIWKSLPFSVKRKVQFKHLAHDVVSKMQKISYFYALASLLMHRFEHLYARKSSFSNNNLIKLYQNVCKIFLLSQNIS